MAGLGSAGRIEGDADYLPLDEDEPGTDGVSPFGTTPIQDIEIGDSVWSRDEADPEAELELNEVEALFSRIAYNLQRMTISDESGNVETNPGDG